jgi:hypothetical protein
MTAKTASLLADPHPKCHIVFPYTSDHLIAEAVSMFAAGGLSRDESVVLITTPPHRDLIERRLQLEGFSLKDLRSQGRYIILDAEDTLDNLMSNGMPSPTRFAKLVGNLIQSAKSNSPNGKARLFGEMVSLLYGENLAGAAQLEELWNAAIDAYGVPLLCTYALDGPERESQAAFPASLLEAHTHTLPM